MSLQLLRKEMYSHSIHICIKSGGCYCDVSTCEGGRLDHFHGLLGCPKLCAIYVEQSPGPK